MRSSAEGMGKAGPAWGHSLLPVSPEPREQSREMVRARRQDLPSLGFT